MGGRGFDQIPTIAPRVAPNGDATVRFIARLFFKNGTCSNQTRLIGRKITRLQKKPDPPAALRPDRSTLLVPFGAGQHQTASPAGWRDRDPAFTPLRDILAQGPAQTATEKADGRIIIRYNQ